MTMQEQGNTPDLSPEEDAALDAFWDKVASGEIDLNRNRENETDDPIADFLRASGLPVPGEDDSEETTPPESTIWDGEKFI